MGRPQVPKGQQPGGPRPLPAGGPDCRQTVPSQHRRDLRRRRPGRTPLYRHAVHRGTHPQRVPRGGSPAAGPADAGCLPRGPSRPRERGHPPGPQAPEHHRRGEGGSSVEVLARNQFLATRARLPSLRGGLRAGEGNGRPFHAIRGGQYRRDASLHVPGAGPGRRGHAGRPQRRLFSRRHLVRALRGQAAVPEFRSVRSLQNDRRAGSPNPAQLQSGREGRSREHHPEMPREESLPAICDGAGTGGGSGAVPGGRARPRETGWRGLPAPQTAAQASGAFGALLATLLAIVGGSAVIVTGNLSRARERRSEEVARRGALEAAELSRRALEAVKDAKALWRVRSSSREQWEALFREAETLARAALEKDPDLAAGHYTLGEIRQSRGSPSEAVRSFERAVALDAGMPSAWYRLGLCRLELYTDTMLGPGIIEVSLSEKEGFARRESRAEPHKKAAIAALRRYEQLRGVKEESSTLFRCSQAAIAIAEGRYEEAEGICSEILSETKTDEQVWLLKAMALCSRKDYGRALEALDALTSEVMPQLSQAHYLIGWIREKQKDFPKAITACSRALELNPSCAAAWVTRAWARCGMNDETAMIEDATRAIEIDPTCAPAYYARGWARERRKELKAAVEDYGRIIALHPDYAPVYTIRAWALEKMEEWKSSLKDYAQAVALGSHEAHDFANCGRIRSQLGEYEQAIEDYTRALQCPSPKGVLHAERGKAHLALKRYNPALQDFRAALKLDGSLQGVLGPPIAQCEAAGQHR